MASNKPLRAKVGIALDNQGSNPDAETDEVVLFKKTKGSGGTGVVTTLRLFSASLTSIL